MIARVNYMAMCRFKNGEDDEQYDKFNHRLKLYVEEIENSKQILTQNSSRHYTYGSQGKH